MNENQPNGKLPLGLCKQAFMKLDSFMTDIKEIREDEDLDPDTRNQFDQMAEITGTMMAVIVNIVGAELEEEKFLKETIPMDEIDQFPDFDHPPKETSDSDNLLDTPIE